MNELLAYFEKGIFMSDEIRARLKAIVREKNLEKGEFILHTNSAKKEHIFVTQGCLRSFYLSDNGKENTIQFATKNWWIADYMTLYTDATAVLSIESLMPSKVLLINKQDIEDIYSDYPAFNVFQRKKFESHTAALQKRILNLLARSAAERYEVFIREYADFERLIPNYQIASYLGITAESLSRIRKARVGK